MIVGVVNLQSGNECDCSNIVTVINHGHLVLKITDIVFEGYSCLHIDGEVVVVSLELLSQGILVEEGITNLLKASKRLR